MAEHLYSAFGMRIRSFLPLALPPAPKVKTAGSDPKFPPTAWPIEIVEGTVRPAELPHSLGNIRYGRSDRGIQFDIPWAARYSIEGDARIVVERIPGAREDFAGLYLSGLILATMLGARGVLTLHGSAVVGSLANNVGSLSGTASPRSLVFIGDKGAGKSTTAAALSAHGYHILCDDVIPIAPGPVVLPGIPLPKLLADAYENLIGDPCEAPHLFDGVNKYQVSLPSSDKPAPLSAIFALEISGQATAQGQAAAQGQADQARANQAPAALRIEPIKGAAKIQRVLQNAMSLQGIDDPASVFSRCAEMLASVPCYRVIRPAGKNCLDELVEAIITLDKKLGSQQQQNP